MLLGATLYPRPIQVAAIEFAIEQRRLTPRQSLVLSWLLEGYDETEIGCRLHRSTATVHEHMQSIYRHFDVQRRAQLLAYFVRREPVVRKGAPVPQ